MRFVYEGFDKRGTPKRGHVEADSLEAVAEKLRNFGIIPQNINPDGSELPRTLPGGDTLDIKDDTPQPARQDPAAQDRRPPTWQVPTKEEPKRDVAEVQTIRIQRGDWKARLEKDLAMVSDVMDHMKSLPVPAHLPIEAVKAGMLEASTLLVKEAVGRAVKARIAEG